MTQSMLRKVLAGLLFAALWVPFGVAQERPQFEVATGRVSKGDASQGSWSHPGVGSFSAHSLTLEWLMVLAYGVDKDQIANKPSWLGTDTFDVTAKPADGVALSREELRPRLQALLEGRFHLATHTEMRPMPGYALVVAKGGPKLQTTKGSLFPNYRVSVTDRELHGLNWSMQFLASMLQKAAGRPVVDRTGLGGSYDIELEFSSDVSGEGAGDDPRPSIFTAVQETLGLKLEPQKVPVEVLVIDHVDRTPTEN